LKFEDDVEVETVSSLVFAGDIFPVLPSDVGLSKTRYLDSLHGHGFRWLMLPVNYKWARFKSVCFANSGKNPGREA